MKNKKIITNLVFFIAFVSAVATLNGIFLNDGSGKYAIESIRGQQVWIYGKGLYKDMSADVAVQGIAQDWITLCIGIPVLLISLYFSRKNSLKGAMVLSGTMGYFLVTYLFYMTMAMYNKMFLAYVVLIGLTFFAFVLNLFSFDILQLKSEFDKNMLVKYAGIFLMINSVLIAMLWLSIVVPPLLDGTIIPKAVDHYTTLIVQGFDLGLFLPAAFVSGFLAFKKNAYGYLYTTINVILLSLLMTALTSKIAFMARTGQNVIPVIFIIPFIGAVAIIFSVLLIKNMNRKLV